MKRSKHVQKISAVVSLVILALGFSLIGLMSLIHPTRSGESFTSSAISCVIGGSASMATAGVFLFAALVCWRRSTWLAALYGHSESSPSVLAKLEFDRTSAVAEIRF